MRGRFWTAYEREFVRLAYSEIPTRLLAEHLGRSEQSVYNQAQNQDIKKSGRYLKQIRAAGGRAAGHSKGGMRTWFPKGQRPWNKGMKGYDAGGRAAETRFKPGHRPVQWVPVGTEVIDFDGYLKRKVRDDAPAGQSRRNWKYVHVMVWEEHHGPVPPGHAVVFRNGVRSDVRPENLELVSRRELMRRNTRHNYPESINRAITAKAVLTREINKRQST